MPNSDSRGLAEIATDEPLSLSRQLSEQPVHQFSNQGSGDPLLGLLETSRQAPRVRTKQALDGSVHGGDVAAAHGDQPTRGARVPCGRPPIV